MNTLFINLFGGPCTGKSSIAAGIYALLKSEHLECELITEYAKDKIWAEHEVILNDQLYIFAKQHNRCWRLNGKVQYAITDSPLLFSWVYANAKDRTPAFEALVKEKFNRYNNFNVFLRRSTEYSPLGRQQTEVEAKEIDDRILNLLYEYRPFLDITLSDQTVNIITTVAKYFSLPKET